MFRSGFLPPRAEAIFIGKIKQVEMGCGYLALIDESEKIFSWGDNYAVRKINVYTIKG